MSYNPMPAHSSHESGPPLPRIALAVVIRDNKTLVQLRYRRNAGMVHEFPGGKADEGETLVQTAMRELKEETGISDTVFMDCIEKKSDQNMPVAFVVLQAHAGVEPRVTAIERRQTFKWLEIQALQLNWFHAADRE
ncbi:MAG: NUDIX hydrolase, partial [Methylococcales bacterium]|nr:NUDIX hydrolase [Methylococcales bacterium]